MNKKYIYKPYNKLFPKLFEEERTRLMNVLEEDIIKIEHIGSTSVPGLGGKGIIDIGVTTTQKNINIVFRKIETLGYIFREKGSSPERWFFRTDLPDPQDGTRRYHLHLSFPESIEWKNLIFFRNYLRSNQVALTEYADLKKKSAAEVNDDGILYRKNKAPFFLKILNKAFKETSSKTN